jgi:dTMP kinase
VRPDKMIVIEGIDGSGKTTLAKHIAKKYKLPFYKFPVYKDFKILKDFLEGKKTLKEEATFLLFLANILINTNEQKAVYDRYVFSSIAYAHSFDIEKAVNIVNSLPFLKPDILIYLDVDPLTAFKRKTEQRKREKNMKVSIRENEEVLTNVRKRYLYLAERRFMTEWFIIDANKNMKNVFKEAEKIVEMHLKK